MASVLDERIGQEMLAENLLIFDGDKPVGVVDLRELVRHFLPYEVRETELEALAALGDVDLPRHSQTAARWCLRGVQAGPSVDGVIFLWFAVEALTGTSKKKPIEDALQAAGRDPAEVVFHDELPGSDTEPIPAISWGEMLPAIETRAKVTVTGGHGQDANMIRRIAEVAAFWPR